MHTQSKQLTSGGNRRSRKRHRALALFLITIAGAGIVIVAYSLYAFFGAGPRPGLSRSDSEAGGADYNVTILATAPVGREVIVNAANPCTGYLPPGSYHYWTCVWALSWGCPQGCTGNLSALAVTNASLVGDVGSGAIQLYSTHVWSPSEVPPNGQGQSIIAVTGEAQLGGTSAPTLNWWANLTVQVGP